MAHVRQQVITAFMSALNGLATSGSRRYDDRAEEYELQESELPALRIYDEGDEAQDIGLGNGVGFATYQRPMTVVVEANAKAASGASTTIRTMCAEVETVLGVPLDLGGGVQVKCFYRGTEVPKPSGAADRVISVARMRFEVELFTHSNAPETLA